MALTPAATNAPPWRSWRQVPLDVEVVKLHGPFFLEIFSGTARLTDHVAAMGVPVLPPVDIERSPLVPEPADVLDLGLWDRSMQLDHSGSIVCENLGTPCNTFS